MDAFLLHWKGLGLLVLDLFCRCLFAIWGRSVRGKEGPCAGFCVLKFLFSFLTTFLVAFLISDFWLLLFFSVFLFVRFLVGISVWLSEMFGIAIEGNQRVVVELHVGLSGGALPILSHSK